MQTALLKEKSFSFALRIIKLYQQFSAEQRELPLCTQLLESGTMTGALVRRSGHAQTDADFVNKLSLAQKECSNTLFLLELLHEMAYLSLLDQQIISAEAEQLLKMLTASIKTVETRNNNN